jgi:hypothetical protein
MRVTMIAYPSLHSSFARQAFARCATAIVRWDRRNEWSTISPTGPALIRHPRQIVFIEKNLHVGFFGSATAERFSRHEALVGVQVK